MTDKLGRLPGDYVASFEFVHPKDIAAALTEKHARRPATMWALGNEVRPSDLYCYLGARFGPPNGLQNLFRNDCSDNLVHWEWYLKSSTGYITIAGLNFRTDVWITGRKLPDSEKVEFLRQIKADFANYGKGMAHLRKEHLEPWIEFVNPYQRLRRAVKQLIKELDELNLDPSSDALPNLLESEDMDIALKQWEDRAADYSRAIGLSFGIRAMVPVMAESFINLLLFILARPSVRADKQLFDGIFRLPMHVRIRSLPYYCDGFKGPIDSDHQAARDYLQLVGTRNDLLHGNIDIEKLKFNELYFYGKVPVITPGRPRKWAGLVKHDVVRETAGVLRLAPEAAVRVCIDTCQSIIQSAYLCQGFITVPPKISPHPEDLPDLLSFHPSRLRHRLQDT